MPGKVLDQYQASALDRMILAVAQVHPDRNKFLQLVVKMI